ncbi:MAG: phage holin family protein [Candidatus Binataceae bacterium]
MAGETDSANSPTTLAENANWGELLSKTVDDLSRIGRTEIELLEVTLKRLIEEQTDKVVGMAFLLVTLAYGTLFLLGGIVLVIHLWLAWWLSFLITAGFVMCTGVAFMLMMVAVARQKTA